MVNSRITGISGGDGGMTTQEGIKYADWKREQLRMIGEAGENEVEPIEEERYVKSMMKQCLNAYVCHKELEALSMCMSENNIMTNEKHQLDWNSKELKYKCKTSCSAYEKCMTTQANHDMVTEAAIGHPHCVSNHIELERCFDRYPDSDEMKKQYCLGFFHKGYRCGLNHLWNEYWRRLTGFGETDEYHLYSAMTSTRQKIPYHSMVADLAMHDGKKKSLSLLDEGFEEDHV